MTNSSLVVTWQPVDALHTYAGNARKHSVKQLLKLKKSLTTFGWANPLIVDENNMVLCGAGRLEAARQLGMERVPTITLSHMSEADKKAFVIADNRIAEEATWSKALLRDELKGLIDIGFDVELTGFDTLQIDTMLSFDVPEPKIDDDVDLPNAEPPVARVGDLWVCGFHRVVVGDARDPLVYDRLMAGARAQMVFTDPPYNCAIAGNASGLGRVKHGNFVMGAGELSMPEFRSGDLKRLIVTMPPRHLKSITISTAWVAWMLGNNPATRFMCASYGEGLALKHASDCLRIMTTDWYRAAFPRLRLVRRAVLDFETSAGGGRLSVSSAGAITGRGADIVILDDPMKADDAMSESAREAVSSTLRTTLINRADDAERGAFILVMQRLHQADIAGELIEKGGWHELRLPAIATHDEQVPLTGERVYQRRTGSALHPERQSKAFLLQKREEDPYVFAGQFQQDPVAPESALLKAKWFGVYDEPPKTGIVVQSCDTAVKKTVRSDWSVVITARYYMGRFYILDVFRKRVSFGQLLAEVRSSCQRHGVERLLIEDASSGQQLIQQLQDHHVPGVPYPIPISATVNKQTRFEAQASKFQSGMVVLPRTAPWLADFVGELMKVPGGRHDDQADALAQMLANPPPERRKIYHGQSELIGPGDSAREVIDPEVLQQLRDMGYNVDDPHGII